MLSTEIAEAARYCLANGINFAVYAMPGSPDVTFIADDGTPWSGDESDMKGFFINSFISHAGIDTPAMGLPERHGSEWRDTCEISVERKVYASRKISA